MGIVLLESSPLGWMKLCEIWTLVWLSLSNPLFCPFSFHKEHISIVIWNLSLPTSAHSSFHLLWALLPMNFCTPNSVSTSASQREPNWHTAYAIFPYWVKKKNQRIFRRKQPHFMSIPFGICFSPSQDDTVIDNKSQISYAIVWGWQNRNIKRHLSVPTCC